MEHITAIKNSICAACGIVGGWIAHLYGGWSDALGALLIFMALDYITGLIVAGVFHSSIKSSGGGLDSRISWKGLCRKVGILVAVLACHLIDVIVGTNYVRDAVVIFFCANEGISILENLGLMGIPLPDFLGNMLDQLREQSAKK